VSPRRSLLLLAALLAAMLALPACGGGDGDGGSGTHALGEQAAAGYQEPSGKKARTTLGITVTAVRKGSQEDLTKHGFEVDKDAQSSTPYYVDVRYANQGQATVEKNIDVSLEDSDGNLIGSTLIFNYGNRPFPPCEEVSKGQLAPGQSYESCTLFLVPKGTDVGKVSFLSNEGPDVEPEFVYWKAG
jgi:hypothetical protein